MNDLAIVWFRNDLRLQDNESLNLAVTQGQTVMPVYIFDSRVFKGKTKYGFPKTGKFRCQFIIEAVKDLRLNLQNKGSDLVVRIGKPENIIIELAKEHQAKWVYCNRERTDEEARVQDKIENKLWELGKEMIYSRGKMLYYTSDLPFPVQHVPDTFTAFRKEVEKYVKVRRPLSTPEDLKGFQLHKNIEWGVIPTIEDFGHLPFDNASKFIGGESYALKQLKFYLWDSDLISDYKNTRNGLLGWDFSSKLSAWLSAGCLSPKTVYHEIKKYEQEKVANESTYWLVFELIWRDYFRMIGKKNGNKIFQQTGIRNKKVSTLEDHFLFDKWANGQTGIPFIDANMRELNATGFMSNRGRQNVASFLINDLKLNWLMGAEYFESLLIDYDPCSNYGNWNYLAGIGNDPREDRYFNINTQVKKYDENGIFTKHWLPELRNLPGDYMHHPHDLPIKQQQNLNFIIGKNYPKPLVKLSR
jgi:deoxyribodipyrimidine photo-lyase